MSQLDDQFILLLLCGFFSLDNFQLLMLSIK